MREDRAASGHAAAAPMALDGESDNSYKRMTALSQSAAASIALFQSCCRFEAVSLRSAVANSENELIAWK